MAVGQQWKNLFDKDILKKSVKVPIVGEIPPEKEIDEDEVMSGNMIILNAMIDMLANDSNANYKEVCEAIGLSIK